jgi:hypothetical protein
MSVAEFKRRPESWGHREPPKIEPISFREYIRDMLEPSEPDRWCQCPYGAEDIETPDRTIPAEPHTHSLAWFDGGQGLPFSLVCFIARNAAHRFPDAPQTKKAITALCEEIKTGILNELRIE